MSKHVYLPGNTTFEIQQALNKLADQIPSVGSNSGGHIIIVNGVVLPQQPYLYFKGVDGENEPVDESTIVTVPRRVTTAERATIQAFDGLIVYDTDLNRHFSYNTNAWESV